MFAHFSNAYVFTVLCVIFVVGHLRMSFKIRDDEISYLKEIFSEEEMEVVKRITSKFYTNLRISEWKGRSLLPTFCADTAKYAYENWSMRDGDVLVASYPKTGTAWLYEVMRQIVHTDDRDSKLSSQLPITFRSIEVEPVEKFPLLDKLPLRRRVFWTHLSSDLIDIEGAKRNNVKIIYPVRNPKDQMVSFLHFIQSIPPGQVEPIKTMFNSGWDKYFEHMIQGEILSSTRPGEWYPDHILSWYKHRDNKNVCFVYFEDMKGNLEEQVKKLAKFVGAPMTDERAKKIVEACTFANMKKTRESKGEAEALRAKVILRKGGVGGWKDYFTVSQSEKIDAIMDKKLKDTDIKFSYEL